MENSDGRIRVRKYRKSSVPRLRWTPELHRHFVEVVRNLGGKYRATPKKIMQMMAVKGLMISHIKSHLQMYRSTKESIDPNGSIAIKNYQEKKSDNYITMLPLRQIKGKFTGQGRRKITQNDENLFLHEFEGKNGSTTKTKRDGELIPRATMETSDKSINLDLTMSCITFMN